MEEEIVLPPGAEGHPGRVALGPKSSGGVGGAFARNMELGLGRPPRTQCEGAGATALLRLAPGARDGGAAHQTETQAVV